MSSLQGVICHHKWQEQAHSEECLWEGRDHRQILQELQTSSSTICAAGGEPPGSPARALLPICKVCLIVTVNYFIFKEYIVRFRISQLLNLTNIEVYPPLSHCHIPGLSVCPTKDSDQVRLRVLLAAKNHGIDEISVPKTG